MALNKTTCEHLNNLQLIHSKEYVCEECIKTGDMWVHLRICQTCGKVHCCDASKNKHSTKHFHQTNHPVVISAEPGEKWAWCYQDELFLPF
jgi:uncharacterized UBP type Zn finger protein